jgi:hypothetical protein
MSLIFHLYNYLCVSMFVNLYHRHLSNKECLMACTACHVCFISTVNGCSKKIKIKGKCLGRSSASSGHTTKLKQSIFFRYLWSVHESRLINNISMIINLYLYDTCLIKLYINVFLSLSFRSLYDRMSSEAKFRI